MSEGSYREDNVGTNIDFCYLLLYDFLLSDFSITFNVRVFHRGSTDLPVNWSSCLRDRSTWSCRAPRAKHRHFPRESCNFGPLELWTKRTIVVVRWRNWTWVFQGACDRWCLFSVRFDSQCGCDRTVFIDLYRVHPGWRSLLWPPWLLQLKRGERLIRHTGSVKTRDSTFESPSYWHYKNLSYRDKILHP